MKTIPLFLTAFVLFIFVSCSKPTVEAPVDPAVIKKEVSALMDQFHSTMKAKDASAQMALLAEDGFYCGTDPDEVFDKKTITDYMTKALADTALVIEDYVITKREIKVDDNGQCAFVLDQFVLKVISPTIPIRLTTHATKQDGKWLLDFTSLAMIPKNADLKKMNEVVK